MLNVVRKLTKTFKIIYFYLLTLGLAHVISKSLGCEKNLNLIVAYLVCL